ncbi:alpha-amylase family glycosyl hydrolase [Bacillus sp. REN3]|nr:alpha-amylase family glycosyl hydrolase [Bacillus sp. REN3]
MDYLDKLGVNTIWVSPIVENIKHDVRYDNPKDIPLMPTMATGRTISTS